MPSSSESASRTRSDERLTASVSGWLARVREVAAAQHGGGARVRQRRRVDVAAVRRVCQERRRAGEVRRHVGGQLDGREPCRRRSQILDPRVGAEIEAPGRPPTLRIRSQLVAHQTEQPGVEAVAAGVDVLGERPLELPRSAPARMPSASIWSVSPAVSSSTPMLLVM